MPFTINFEKKILLSCLSRLIVDSFFLQYVNRYAVFFCLSVDQFFFFLFRLEPNCSFYNIISYQLSLSFIFLCP